MKKSYHSMVVPIALAIATRVTVLEATRPRFYTGPPGAAGAGVNMNSRGSPRPLRTVTHRLPACRRGAHRALQLAVRAAARRHVRAPHRGHRRGAIVGGHGHRNPRRAALARIDVG